MTGDISFHYMNPGEEGPVCDLVRRVFDRFVSPHYTDIGIKEFYKIFSPDALIEACGQSGHVVLVAVKDEEIVGVVKIKDENHISWLFVKGDCQKQGIAKELIRRSMEKCQSDNPALFQMTVNSSPNAIPAYIRFGFTALGPESENHGMRITPMALDIPGERRIRKETANI
ncbi:MAG: GNAT family N-acetyltransferase [Deltaproteobacteria bacterium]|nr:GNAT family N-acetyltransferase [Deltaproteobacteria bacterium]